MSNDGRATVHWLRDALARVVKLREALADADLTFAAAIAERLEHDLAAELEQLADSPR